MNLPRAAPGTARRQPAILVAGGRDGDPWDLGDAVARRGYRVMRAPTLGGALPLARQTHPELVILDAAASDPEGLDVSRALRRDSAVGVSTPVLLATREHPTPGHHRDALRAGIWGALTPPLGDEELAAILDSFMAATRHGERGGGERSRDAASGLYDLDGLAQRARELTLQAFHHHAGLACVALASAPEACETFARALAAGGRESDAIGRLGETEFAVVAPGTDPAGALKLAARLARLAPSASLHAGYDAVGNVRYTPLVPKNLLARARGALRVAQSTRGGTWIRAFQETPG